MGTYVKVAPNSNYMYEDENYEDKLIRNANVHRGGFYAGVVRVLALIVFICLAIAFIFIASFNAWNTRLDYNTDFVGRDCISGGSSHKGVCQETSLLRVHAVDMNWWAASGYTSTSIALLTLMVMLWSINFGRIHWDADWGDEDFFGEQLEESTKVNERGLFSKLYLASEFVANESLNGVMLHFTFAQIFFGPFLGVIMFAMCGLRDFHTLGFVFVAYFMLGLVLLAAQVEARKRTHRGSMPNIQVKVNGGVNVGLWTLPVLFTLLNLFVWGLLLVYAFKFPHASRDWYFKAAISLHSIFYALQNIYFLGYFGSRDIIFGGYGAGANSNGFAVLGLFAGIPFRVMQSSALWGIASFVLGLMLIVPFSIFAIFYVLVRICTMIYMWIDTPLHRRDAVWMSGHTFMNLALNAVIIALAFLPLLIMGGRNNDSNIANIKFPTHQILGY
jgi:hypothetical protein